MKKNQGTDCIELNNMDKQIKYRRLNMVMENQYLTIVICISTIALSIDFWLVKRFICLVNLL